MAYRCAILIGSQRIMFVFMQFRVHKLGGVPNMRQCKRDWWKLRYCRLLMLDVFMLSGRMWPRVRLRAVRMAIVLHDHGACRKSFCIAIRFTLRKEGSYGTVRLWRK
jgi:hypothetical protein